jgi:TolB-like protein/Tfp pilus assembly protein PilF
LADVGNRRDEYFSTALVDEITTRLVQLPRLEIKARNSVLGPPSPGKDLTTIGKELGVDYILEGSVNWAQGRDDSNRVRVLARLTNVATGTLVWSTPFEGSTKDLFRLHVDIAQAAARALSLSLGADEAAALRAQWTRDTLAYLEYRVGRFQWRKRTPEGLRLAVDHFQRAVEHDSSFARAWAALADAYVLFGQYGAARGPGDTTGIPREEAYNRARLAARRAIAMDSTLAEAHAALGEVIMYQDRDWSAAERSFREAIRLDPSYATAQQWYAELLTVVGRPAEAVDHGLRAAELDPTTPIVVHSFAIALLALRRYDEAASAYRRILELDPGFGYGHQGLLWSQLGRRNVQDALTALEAAGDTSAWMKAWVRGVIDPSATPEAARMLLDNEATVSMLPLAIQANLYAGAGLDTQALDVLSRIVADRGATIPGLKVLPLFDRLRKHPRFRALVAAMNFPPDP